MQKNKDMRAKQTHPEIRKGKKNLWFLTIAVNTVKRKMTFFSERQISRQKKTQASIINPVVRFALCRTFMSNLSKPT